MPSLKTSDHLALSLLLSEDLYLLKEEEIISSAKASPPETVPAKKEEEVFYNYLGENNKYLLLLVDDPQNKIIDKKELESLINILQAKKLELRDVAILNINSCKAIAFEQLKSFFASRSMVLFGINPSRLEVPDIVSNKISEYKGVKLLATYSFAEMQNDTVKKRVFWNEMKLL
ncbi:hypothetical protein [Rubrolithibacter danxiaensis]|uniref:hypothetical protein n=1 Tax=Rubrolithibacter danxiaensis TaxID=3390805 RepID=UPI003BF89B6D